MFQEDFLYKIIGTIILLYLLFLFIKRLLKNKKYKTKNLSKIDTMSGEEFELFLCSHFTKLHYYVKHIGKSGDYGADLILRKRNDKIAVQAKRYKAKVGVAAIQQVIAAKEYYHCNKAIVVTNSFFTKNAKTLAKNCNVELWDRNTLKKKFGVY